MNILNFIWTNGLSFLFILTVIVFIHELGHYLVARYNGVRIEVFSIGFGPELFGWNDKAGTRWKLSLLPLGGYVKMFGRGELGPLTESQSRTLERMDTSLHRLRDQIQNLLDVTQFATCVVALQTGMVTPDDITQVALSRVRREADARG